VWGGGDRTTAAAGPAERCSFASDPHDGLADPVSEPDWVEQILLWAAP
jgi:hypothetical protein